MLTMLKSYLYFGNVSSVTEMAERIGSITSEEIVQTTYRHLRREQRQTLIYR